MTRSSSILFRLWLAGAALPLCVALGSATACAGTAPESSTPCPSRATAAPTPAAPAAVPAPEPPAPEPLKGKPRYTIGNSEVTVLESSNTGKTYELIVGLPGSYQKEPDRRYPIWYQLDGQWDFALVNALTGGLVYDEVVPEIIVVGLSYGGKNPDYQALRDDDYPPTRAKTHDGRQLGGGGPKFLAALEREIIPRIESTYRADPQRRVLAGSSFGGLFALYALFEKPELFSATVALSPAVGWDDRWLFQRQREFHASNSELDERVWISFASDEWPDFAQHIQAFQREFRAARYRGLTLENRVIQGERHAGNKPEGYNRAMRFVFADTAR